MVLSNYETNAKEEGTHAFPPEKSYYPVMLRFRFPSKYGVQTGDLQPIFDFAFEVMHLARSYAQ
jgi:hypothetical protein